MKLINKKEWTLKKIAHYRAIFFMQNIAQMIIVRKTLPFYSILMGMNVEI